MIESVLKAKWYTVLAIAGGVLFFHSVMADKVHFERSGLALLGAGMVMFGSGMNVCMTMRTVFLDSSQTPMGVGPMKGEGEVHRFTVLGVILYLGSIAAFGFAGKVFFFD